MKKLPFLFLVVALAACSITRLEKKRYLPGYHIEFASTRHRVIASPAIAEKKKLMGEIKSVRPFCFSPIPGKNQHPEKKNVAAPENGISLASKKPYVISMRGDSLKNVRREQRFNGLVIAGTLMADTGVLAVWALPLAPWIFIGLGLVLLGVILMVIGLRIKGHHTHDPFLAAGLLFLMLLIPLYLLVKGIIRILRRAGIIKKKAEADQDMGARTLWLEFSAELLLFAACLPVCYMLFTTPIHIVYSPYAFLIFTVLLFFFALITLWKLISYYGGKSTS